MEFLLRSYGVLSVFPRRSYANPTTLRVHEAFVELLDIAKTFLQAH